MNKTAILNLANKVAAQRDSAVIVYSGTIDMDGYGQLLEVLQPTDEQPKRRNVLLVLTTGGGDANAAYLVARTLQRSFEEFDLFVPTICKSAGTLVALGSRLLIIDDVAELGPLDVQLYQKDEIGQRRSGLLLRTAFEGLRHETRDLFEELMLQIKISSKIASQISAEVMAPIYAQVSPEALGNDLRDLNVAKEYGLRLIEGGARAGAVEIDTASKIASQISAEVMAPIYAQVSPEALGNDLRDLNVAKEYGLRLIEGGRNAKSKAIQKLVNDYPSHDFIIDCDEARSLFEKVEPPDDDLSDLISELGPVVFRAGHTNLVVRIDRQAGEENEDAQPGEEGPDSSSEVDEGCEGTREGDTGYGPTDSRAN